MAFDGITIANMVKEFQDTIVGGKINKIAQPEADELLITIKNNKTQYRLLISASASLPLIYFTDKNKISPLTAPNFCMLLRKHIGSGKIVSIIQPDMERAIEFRIEHLNELGDICYKTLVVEIMGKHSNIIFLNEDRMILDSIKHISGNVSSVREVLPGRDYFLPKTQEKYNPLTVSEEEFFSFVCEKTHYSGQSPLYFSYRDQPLYCRGDLLPCFLRRQPAGQVSGRPGERASFPYFPESYGRRAGGKFPAQYCL